MRLQQLVGRLGIFDCDGRLLCYEMSEVSVTGRTVSDGGGKHVRFSNSKLTTREPLPRPDHLTNYRIVLVPRADPITNYRIALYSIQSYYEAFHLVKSCL